MKALAYTLTVAFALTLTAPAQSLDQLESSFMARYKALNQDRDQKLETLTGSYTGALNRLMDQLKQTGDLDTVLPVRDELAAIEKDAPSLPKLRKTAPRQLRSLRNTYIEARDKIIQEHATDLNALVDKMQELLKNKETELTRKGDLDAALAARKMRSGLLKQLGIEENKPATAEPTKDAPARDAAGFMDLLKFPYKIEYSTVYTGPVSGEGGEGKLSKQVQAWHLKGHKKPEEIFVMGPRSSVEFSLPERISEFKGTARVLTAGNVIFRVVVHGKVVLEQQLGGANPGPKALKCSFSPTRRITLHLDPNGNPTNDCASWIQPRVK